MRGYGRSSVYTDHSDYALEHVTRDMIELLGALGEERAVWVGHDWGSFIGFTFALSRPERVARFVAMGGWHPWPKIDHRAVLAMRRFWYQWAIDRARIGRGFSV